MRKYSKILIKKFLFKEYIKNKKTTIQIAKETKISLSTIWRHLKKLNIKVRTITESLKGKYIGKKASGYIDGRCSKIYYCKCGIKLNTFNVLYCNTKSCRSCAGKIHSQKMKGESNPNYKDGLNKIKYGSGFHESLKQQIRKRDNYTCQICGIVEEEHIVLFGQKLSIHHIDYDKQNCDENNLICLCQKCNCKANFNRDYWYAYFTYIMEELGEK